MRVGLLIAFAGRNCGGPEVFEREIVRAMATASTSYEYHLYCLDRRAREVIDFEGGNVFYHQLQPRIRAVALMTSLPLAMSRTRPEVFYAPVIPPPFCPPRTIMSMPCSSLLRHPEFYPPHIRWRLRFLLHRAVRKSAKVICPSAHIRDVVEECLGVPADRLPVIHPGVSPQFRPIAEDERSTFLAQRYGIRGPYFLFSGRWEKRKNILGTLQAFALFKRNHRSEHKLVLTGGQSWDSSEVHEAMVRHRVADMVVDLGKSPVEELPYLYAGADGLIYASLWEGFGMPIVEAMACGAPVITSDVAAMPETAGGCALLVDPHSPEQIADAMQRLASDTTLRARLSTMGLKRAQRFSWETAARQTFDLYEDVAGRTQLSSVA